MTRLDTIRSIISEPLQLMEKEYRQRLFCPVPLVNEINEYLWQRNGKQIRPILVLLSAMAGNPHISDEDLHTRVKLAIAMEILHNSSLMHDDVVDESPLRRGRDTVRQRWSNKIAVLCGDFYLAHVMDILNEIGQNSISKIVNDTVIEMSEGELLQQQVSRTLDLSTDNYYNVIYKKTASLLATCCQIGYSPLRPYGEAFGMAFQIRDDIMDYHPDAETGKPQGNDIRERKMTLPLLCHLEASSEEERRHVMALMQADTLSDEEADRLVSQVAHSGALSAATAILNSKVDQALQALAPLPPSPYRDALSDLALMMKL